MGNRANGLHANGGSELSSTGTKLSSTGTRVIFGGAGFVGSNLAHHGLSQGATVRVVDNLSRPGVERNLAWLEQHPQLQVMRGDIRDYGFVCRAVEGASQVFHLAGQVAVTSSLVDPLYDEEVNVRGTLHILEALRHHNPAASLLFTSTNKVYGRLGDVDLIREGDMYVPADAATRSSGISESRPLQLLSPYGCSKGAADQYVLDYAQHFGLKAAVFRMSCIYGARQFGTEDQGWVAHFLVQALQERPITVYGDGYQARDLLYVDDLVGAMVAAQQQMDRLSGRAFNVGGGPSQSLSLRQLLNYIGDQWKLEPSVTFKDWRPGDQRYYASDTSALEHALGWKPQVNVTEGLDRLSAWIAEWLGIRLPRERVPEQQLTRVGLA